MHGLFPKSLIFFQNKESCAILLGIYFLQLIKGYYFHSSLTEVINHVDDWLFQLELNVVQVHCTLMKIIEVDLVLLLVHFFLLMNRDTTLLFIVRLIQIYFYLMHAID